MRFQRCPCPPAAAHAPGTSPLCHRRTFGLKNKKKSAKVQKFIATVQKSQGNGRSKEAEAAHARKRKEEKLAQKAAEREMMALLGDSFTSKDKKVKKKKKKASPRHSSPYNPYTLGRELLSHTRTRLATQRRSRPS